MAQDLYPGAPVAGFGLPAGPRGVYRVSMKTEGNTVPVSHAFVLIDPRSGKVLRDTGAVPPAFVAGLWCLPFYVW